MPKVRTVPESNLLSLAALKASSSSCYVEKVTRTDKKEKNRQALVTTA